MDTRKSATKARLHRRRSHRGRRRITGGNFRLVQRLFAQIQLIMEINNLRTVTSEVVETARESLVIGSL
jgi:hypothetical protein